jgi:hypothetical protein
LVSYLDCFISSLALASSPRLPSEAYGLYSAVSFSPSTIGGMLWVAMSPRVEPPQACWMPALSITQLTALRTWTSSNGGVAQFMVMYQVRSPELLCR